MNEIGLHVVLSVKLLMTYAKENLPVKTTGVLYTVWLSSSISSIYFAKFIIKLQT